MQQFNYLFIPIAYHSRPPAIQVYSAMYSAKGEADSAGVFAFGLSMMLRKSFAAIQRDV
jgi:hypothetical protein